jgi:hypothetical protein
MRVSDEGNNYMKVSDEGNNYMKVSDEPSSGTLVVITFIRHSHSYYLDQTL